MPNAKIIPLFGRSRSTNKGAVTSEDLSARAAVMHDDEVVSTQLDVVDGKDDEVVLQEVDEKKVEVWLMAKPKRHLLVRGKLRAACGIKEPRHWSNNPAEVTCRGCMRTLQMADVEIAQNNPDVRP